MPAARPGRKLEDQGTRQQLLEAAGQVFAEKGFERATGKEICERAGTNTAAVNYYFGGMEGLYAAVLQEACSRLVPFEAAAAAVASKAEARDKLEAMLGLGIRTLLTGPAPSSWALRVVSREVFAPSSAMDLLREKEFLPKMRLLKAIVGELMGLPDDHPAVARGCISIIAPGFLIALFDRRALKQAFPNLDLTAAEAEVLVHHAVQFSLGGLSAIAGDVRQEASERLPAGADEV